MEQHQVGSAFNPYRQFERFDVIPDCIANLPTISPLAKLVYGHLVRRAGKNGRAFPSVESIGKHFSVSERQARRAVTELRTENLIRTVRRVNEYGQTTNLYEFIWHKWMGCRTETSAPGRTETSAIRDKGEEPSLEQHDIEPLATNATHSQPAESAVVLSAVLHRLKSGGQKGTPRPTRGQMDCLRRGCVAAAERPLSDAAIASVLNTIAHVPDAPYAYYTRCVINAYADERNGYNNWRADHGMASPDCAYDPTAAELMEELRPTGAVQ